jgi:hypothetical protein
LHKEAKKHHDHKEEEEEKEIEIELPPLFVLGVTASLAGLFLCIVPIPICQQCGKELLRYGIPLALEEYVNRDRNEKNKRND